MERVYLILIFLRLKNLKQEQRVNEHYSIDTVIETCKGCSGGFPLSDPPDPDTPEPKPTDVKPNCGPGKYAAKNPSGFWVCLDIPKGR